ncbi:glycoside hydrolase family 127 protein [Actinocrinis sp.]|uniref:glycoside hydrolase family 127 protein n=1 Tax=Actinocrinis sp. TaxID=1920516 RepID=UPI002D73407D|nr:beta-L-arabinofuranosidase domain-containing protein [Actinocrinis sp.]HZP52944.1 beta-L-arabinofuranosidase domain-containing protein [Actinocrinis sp.]
MTTDTVRLPVPHAGQAPNTGRPVAPRRARLRPLPLTDVHITGGYWAELQRRNQSAILPHVEHWLERAGWLGNFDAARERRLPADRRGREFSDSEVYKALEAMAWELGRRPDPALQERFDAIVARIAAAQEPDGYLNTEFGRPGQGPRWSDLEWGHELYCIGFLIQAAVARARTGHPEDRLFEVARRAADLVCAVFGERGIASVDGHAEIESALVEFYRVTGEPRYLEQARLFVERRGHQVLKEVEFGREYFQDDLPVREAEVFRGHAVRALYFAAGAVDLADETDDDALHRAVARQWRRTVARRTYITGGMGSRHQDEAFAEDFVLPADRAYSETCAGVASVMLAWRLLLAEGDPVYADLIERTLFNVVSTSPSGDGRAFFYTNTLHRRELGSPPEPDRPSVRAAASLRAPWFEVSCCPTNVARTLASLTAYLATADDEGLQLHQYVSGTVSHHQVDGQELRVTVTTDYPYDGRIRVRIDNSADRPWSLSLRVPGWATQGASVTAGGHTRPAGPGVITERNVWQAGDEVVLHLPMTPRLVQPDPRIDAVRGCVAVERGPLVLALESVDVPGMLSVNELRVDVTQPPRVAADGRVMVRCHRVPAPDHDWPYSQDPDGHRPEQPVDLGDVPLVPYHAWANRGPSTMRVWLPTYGAHPQQPLGRQPRRSAVRRGALRVADGRADPDAAPVDRRLRA